MSNQKQQTEQNGDAEKQVPEQLDGRNVVERFNTSDGRDVAILEGKGKDSQRAVEMAGDDPGTYPDALKHILVRIDGKKLTVEDFGELPLKVYNQISTRFNNLYFLE